MRSLSSLSTRMRVNWLLPSMMVTRSAGPGTIVTIPPPRSSTERNCGSDTTSVATAGAAAANARAKSGRMERMTITLFFKCATYVALQLQRVQPGLQLRAGSGIAAP